MDGFLTVMVAAMVAQLFVLPGEKVQFIIAGLATRYNPLTVVSAAGLAFAGWTALEIWFGQALKGAVPPVYLDIISGGLFLLFGVLLLRSMPEGGRKQPGPAGGPATEPNGGALGGTDDGSLDVSVLGIEVPDRFGNFLPIFVLMAAGEFGDKTQLVTISLAVRYGAHPGIWIGEMLVIIPVSLANAYFFSTFTSRFNAAKAHLVGAALFFFFGFDTFLSVLVGVSIWETLVDAVSGVVQSVVGTLAPTLTALA